MPAVLSKIRPQHITAAVATGTAFACYMAYVYHQSHRRWLHESKPGRPNPTGSKDRKIKAHVDMTFMRRIWQILRILVPGPLTAETFYLILVAGALISRTYADVWMIENGTAIEASIIGRNTAEFRHQLFRYVLSFPTISVVNNMLKLGLNELKLRFRRRLTRHLYDQYMHDFTFYKMINIDNRLANPDQILSQDVEKFCESVVDLYSNLSKPILDMVLYVTKLTGRIGAKGPFQMILYLLFSGLFLTYLRRPLGRMTVVEQQLEGEFRHVNSRLLTNSEEIAFYQGSDWERASVLSTFKRLFEHLQNVVLFRFSMGFVDNIVGKYMATTVGYYVVSRSFLDLKNERINSLEKPDLIAEYYQNGRMLLRLAEAIGRLALAGREMTRLAGFTARVTELRTVLRDLNEGRYVRTMVTQGLAKTSSGAQLMDVKALNLAPGSGDIVTQDKVIRFEAVPLVTPNGDVLIESLDFEVPSGVNVLVCGPNGCGKSSLFRVLGGLWPLWGGRLIKPASGKLFYIPQRPYMVLGTLRDQVIYPDSVEAMRAKGVSDGGLEKFLEIVCLSYILEREGGWDAVQDWMDVLSGGEKQRVAMARLFYHAPQFAILDECTSAVSVDVEHKLYTYCREVGITLFTVSHRKSLWKHHNFYLHMDGRGSYEYKPIDENTAEFGS